MNIYAIWSIDRTCLTIRCPCRTVSLTKLSSCWTGLGESRTVVRLSHHTTGGLDKGNFNSVISVVSATKLAKFYIQPLYWIERQYVVFFYCNKTKLEPRKTQNPSVDFQSLESEAQSASPYLSRIVEELGFGFRTIWSQESLLSTSKCVLQSATEPLREFVDSIHPICYLKSTTSGIL